MRLLKDPDRSSVTAGGWSKTWRRGYAACTVHGQSSRPSRGGTASCVTIEVDLAAMGRGGYFTTSQSHLDNSPCRFLPAILRPLRATFFGRPLGLCEGIRLLLGSANAILGDGRLLGATSRGISRTLAAACEHIEEE